MIATMQQQSCKRQLISICANARVVTGLEADTEFVRDLCRWAKLAPSALAKRAGLAATTMLRPYNGAAETRISQPTLEKLRAKFPDYPGWRRESPDQLGMMGERPDPHEKADELVYIRQVDISLAMGDPAVVEDYPATQLVPFNLGFVRGLTKSNTDSLLIITGHGDSMEPILLRSDMLMIDMADRTHRLSDQIWAFHYAGGGMIKRLRRVREDGRDQFLIMSANHDVPDQHAEIEDINIIGKLVWVGRRM